MRSDVGNMPPLPGVFPDYSAPIVRNAAEGRELAMARWGMPSPVFALEGRNSDAGVTNMHNTASAHWRRWLGLEAVVWCPSPASRKTRLDRKKAPVWFPFDDGRPLAFFAGTWTPQWKSVRKVKEGATTNDLFAFLSTDPTARRFTSALRGCFSSPCRSWNLVCDPERLLTKADAAVVAVASKVRQAIGTASGQPVRRTEAFPGGGG
jgi:hypothetical protein